MNGPVSLRYHCHQAGKAGRWERKICESDNRNVFMGMTEQKQANKSDKTLKTERKKVWRKRY